jgi:hypothetical protein
LFKERDYVKSAYLARVAYNDDVDQFNVALCIRSECEDNQDLRKAVGDIFADTFNTKEHLDIMFIEKKQEEELMRVCPVFYER